MRAVMDRYASRVMCHDDIRAIRMVYGYAVRRDNNQFDETCRRDFPPSPLQRLIGSLDRAILAFTRLLRSASTIVFLSTLLYLLLRQRRSSRADEQVASLRPQQRTNTHSSPINAFLWHDDHFQV